MNYTWFRPKPSSVKWRKLHVPFSTYLHTAENEKTIEKLMVIFNFKENLDWPNKVFSFLNARPCLCMSRHNEMSKYRVRDLNLRIAFQKSCIWWNCNSVFYILLIIRIRVYPDANCRLQKPKDTSNVNEFKKKVQSSILYITGNTVSQ